MEPEIVVRYIANSALAGQEQRFPKKLITVGRDAKTDIAFDPDEDLIVSHNHAEIYVENGALWIRDLNSRNGTYVNERRVTDPLMVTPQDTIRFGSVGPSATVSLAAPEAGVKGDTLRMSFLGRLMARSGATPQYLVEDVLESEKEDDPTPPLPPPVAAVACRPGHRAEDVRPAADSAKKQMAAPGSGSRRPAAPDGHRPPAGAAAAPARAASAKASPARPAAAEAAEAEPTPMEPVPFTVPRRRSAGPLQWLVIILLAAAFGVGGAAAYMQLQPFWNKDVSSALPPAETASVAIASLGRLEPEGGVFLVGGPAGQTLKSILVQEGQTVRRDAPLAYLSSYDALKADHEAAVTARDEAARQLESTKKYTAALVAEARNAVEQAGKPLDLEVATAEAEIELLRAHHDLAVEDRKQIEKQTNRPDNASQLSRQKLVEQRAERDLTAARKKLEQLQQSVILRRAAAQAQLNAAIANQSRLDEAISLKNAEKTVERAKAQLDHGVLSAPRDGKILKILLREGASVAGQPVLRLGDTQHMVVIAEVYENDVRYVAKEQRAVISSAALPEKLHGKVEQILPTIDRNAMRDVNPTAPEDLRVVEVKIRLDDNEVAKHRELLERLINLQVHVRIARD